MSGVTTYTNCLRIERTDGYVLGITELDVNVEIDDALLLGVDPRSLVYFSAAGYTPTNMQSTSDNSVNNADVEGVLSAVGVQREDIIAGRYDFAKLHVFIYDYKAGTIVKKLGSGHWGEVTLKDGSYVAEFRSLSQQLQQTIGRTFNPECDDQFGGTRCTLDASSVPVGWLGTVTEGSGGNFFFDSTVSPSTDGVWAGGSLTWTGGSNTGEAQAVTDSHGTKIEYATPFTYAVEVGDSYSMTNTQTASDTVSDVGSLNTFNGTGLTASDGHFVGDTLTITSGDNNGLSRTVSQFVGNVFVTADFPYLIDQYQSFDVVHTYSGTVGVVADDLNFSISDTSGIYAGDTIVIPGRGSAVITTDTAGTLLVGAGLTGVTFADAYTIDHTHSQGVGAANLTRYFEAIGTSYNVGSTLDWLTGTNTGDADNTIDAALPNDIYRLTTAASNAIVIGHTFSIIDSHTGSVTSTDANENTILDSTLTGDGTLIGQFAQFTQGANGNQAREITGSAVGSITVTPPFENATQVGEGYKVYQIDNDYMKKATVSAVTDNSVFTLTIAGASDGDYNYGKALFLSGKNAGLHMEVKDYTAGVVTLFLPMPYEVVEGDGLFMTEGCDKKLETCKDRFENHVNFQGFPYIPGQDAVTKFGGQ